MSLVAMLASRARRSRNRWDTAAFARILRQFAEGMRSARSAARSASIRATCAAAHSRRGSHFRSVVFMPTG